MKKPSVMLAFLGLSFYINAAFAGGAPSSLTQLHFETNVTAPSANGVMVETPVVVMNRLPYYLEVGSERAFCRSMNMYVQSMQSGHLYSLYTQGETTRHFDTVKLNVDGKILSLKNTANQQFIPSIGYVECGPSPAAEKAEDARLAQLAQDAKDPVGAVQRKLINAAQKVGTTVNDFYNQSIEAGAEWSARQNLKVPKLKNQDR